MPIIASFVTQIWMARELGAAGLGEYHAAALFITVLTTVLLMGYPSVAAQRIAGIERTESDRRSRTAGSALTVALALALALFFVIFVLADPFRRLFLSGSGASQIVLGLAAVGATLNSFTVHVFLAALELRAATVVIAAQPVGVAAAVGLRVLGGPDLSGSDLAAIGFVVSGTTGLVIFLGHGDMPRVERGVIIDMIRRSGPAMRLTYPVLITGWIDRALISLVLGPSALGAFVAASALVETLQRFVRTIGSIAVGAYARLIADPVGTRRVLDSHLRLAAAIFIVAGAVFIAAGSGMLALIYGPTFGIARTTLRLLSIAALPMTIAASLAAQSVGTDLRASSRLLVLLAVMHVVVATVLTLLFHIAGTALANLIVWGIGSFAYSRQAVRIGAPVQPRSLLHIAGVSAPLFSVAWIVGLLGWPWPVAALTAGLIAIPPVVLILIQEPERRLLRRMLGLGHERTSRVMG